MSTDRGVPIGGTGYKAYTLEYQVDLGAGAAPVQVEPIVIQDATDPTKRMAVTGNRAQVDAHVLARYRIAEAPPVPVAGINYFGYLATNGDWYILKEDTVTGAYRYANLSNNVTITGGFGGAGADKAWVNRAALTYSYLSALTGL